MSALVDLDFRPRSFFSWPLSTEPQQLFTARASARRRFEVDAFKSSSTAMLSNQSFDDKEVRNAGAR
jgi:hypothetical protein